MTLKENIEEMEKRKPHLLITVYYYLIALHLKIKTCILLSMSLIFVCLFVRVLVFTDLLSPSAWVWKN